MSKTIILTLFVSLALSMGALVVPSWAQDDILGALEAELQQETSPEDAPTLLEPLPKAGQSDSADQVISINAPEGEGAQTEGTAEQPQKQSQPQPADISEQGDDLLRELEILATPTPADKAESMGDNQSAATDPQAPPQIPEAYIAEAEQFQKYCEAKTDLRTHHDCECLSANFLDARINKGPHTPRAVIMAKIEATCLDPSEEAFNLYNKCKANTLLLPRSIPAETYCTCYGNEYAKIFEQRKVKVSHASTIKVQTLAHAKCSQRDYAKRNYGEGGLR